MNDFRVRSKHGDTATAPTIPSSASAVATLNVPHAQVVDTSSPTRSGSGTQTNELRKSNAPAAGADKGWNSKNLQYRIAADVVAAGAASGAVSPLIASIDRSVMENVSGRATLKESLLNSFKTMGLRPHVFFTGRPFLLVFTVYFGTYMAANGLDTLLSTLKHKPASTTTHGLPKFAATSSANLGLSIWKDAHFTRIFGASSSPRGVPPISLLLFAVRDSFTIAASFNLPPILAPHIPMQMLPAFMQTFERQNIAQFATPAAVQVLSTPVHLLGLDCYNNPKHDWSQRWAVVRDKFVSSWGARIGRIVPAFGVGGVVNAKVRRSFMKKLE